MKLLEGKAVDDLDGGLDPQKGYKSLLHGESPEIRCFNSFTDEVQFIAAYLKELIKEGVEMNTACLVVRTNDLLKQYEAAFHERGIKTYLVKRSVAEDRKAVGLRLATMHRVKGLEFDEVVIASVNEGIVPLQLPSVGSQSSELAEENENLERALLYVSATRAKKKVVITSYGKKSDLLSNL